MYTVNYLKTAFVLLLCWAKSLFVFMFSYTLHLLLRPRRKRITCSIRNITSIAGVPYKFDLLANLQVVVKSWNIILLKLVYYFTKFLYVNVPRVISCSRCCCLQAICMVCMRHLYSARVPSATSRSAKTQIGVITETFTS